MRKAVLVLGIWLLGCIATNPVYAGTLNEYEAKVVEAAKSQYEYNGMMYQTAPSYIEQLIGYLSSDDVDLNKEQSEEVIQMAYDSVEMGVKEGYLIPVEGQADEATDSSGQESGSSQEAEDILSEQDSTDTDDSNEGKTENQNNSMKPQDELIGHEDLQTSQEQRPSKGIQLIDDIISSNNDKLNDMEDENIAEDIIKNTGFNMNITVSIAVGMGLLMMLGMIVTIRSNYFAHNDE